MSIPEIKPGTNGNHGAPHEASGAFHMDAVWTAPPAEDARRSPTEFPPDVRADTVRAWLYRAYSHEIAGSSVTRWGIMLAVAAALIWATGFLPARWLGVIVAGGLGLLLGIAVTLLRRQDFVRFFESGHAPAQPEITPRAQPAENKFPVYVTGRLDVEGRVARFTALPGFYRTFATREHALLCQLADTRFLRLARRPSEELGMWYAFVSPDQIDQVRTGKLQFDHALRPAIAVDYTVVIPAEGRFKREKEITETLYLVPAAESDYRPILADLLADLPTAAATPSSIAGASPQAQTPAALTTEEPDGAQHDPAADESDA